MGANGKRAARTCTRHPGGHNLANLIRAPSAQTTRPERLWPGALTRRARPDPNAFGWASRVTHELHYSAEAVPGASGVGIECRKLQNVRIDGPHLTVQLGSGLDTQGARGMA